MLSVTKIKSAMLSLSSFLFRRVWKANLLHIKVLPNPLGHKGQMKNLCGRGSHFKVSFSDANEILEDNIVED